MTAQTKVWKPALNDAGQAKCTFEGIFVQEHEGKDGTWESTEALFKILGEDGSEKLIPLRLPSKFAEGNAIGKLAKALGFIYKPVYKKSEDGFKYLESDNLSELSETIENSTGKEYKIKLTLNSKFLWDIDPASIKTL